MRLVYLTFYSQFCWKFITGKAYKIKSEKLLTSTILETETGPYRGMHSYFFPSFSAIDSIKNTDRNTTILLLIWFTITTPVFLVFFFGAEPTHTKIGPTFLIHSFYSSYWQKNPFTNKHWLAFNGSLSIIVQMDDRVRCCIDLWFCIPSVLGARPGDGHSKESRFFSCHY